MYRIYRFMYGLVGFSRSQTNGFIVLLPLLLLILVSPAMIRRFHHHENVYASDAQKLNELVAQLNAPRMDSLTVAPRKERKEFNPNTASELLMVDAGIPEKLAKRIGSYRKKGGVFRQKSDLLKIYGFDSATYAQVAPLLRLDHLVNKNSVLVFPGNTRKKELLQKEDLNSADTASLKKLRGIGEKLSLRIIRYREALGGFVTMGQLKEIYHLDTAIVRLVAQRFMIAPDFRPRQLNLNTVGRQELAIHPYIFDKAADAIVAYRFQHGNFKTLQDLRSIPAVDSAMLVKSGPYLKLED